jgi:UV DNA damage repair endonuclease
MHDFISAHGVRIYSVLAALVPALVLVWPTVPWEALVAASAALLGVGVVAASHEDTKTLKALYEDSPFEAELKGGLGQ